MKEEAKAISANVLNLTDKNFNIKIIEPKVFERPMRVIRQNKELNISASNEKINNSQNQNSSTQPIADEKKNNNTDFIELADNEADKYNRIKNPFDWLEEKLSSKLNNECVEDLKLIYNPDIKLTYLYFNNLDKVSLKSLIIVTNEINNLVDTYYNILSEQINEFISIFLLVFENYISSVDHLEEVEVGGDKNMLTQFQVIHDSLLLFFQKCQKNRTEEMTYLFRFYFVEKLFETMNNKNTGEKLHYICELLYNILDPSDNQQVMFVKMIKENLVSNDSFYECLRVFHDLINNYSEQFMDGCLFYLLSGIQSDFATIRYSCLYILMKYIKLNINFYLNFESKFLFINFRNT